MKAVLLNVMKAKLLNQNLKKATKGLDNDSCAILWKSMLALCYLLSMNEHETQTYPAY